MAELRTHRELTEHGETAIVSALLSLPAAYTVLPHLVLPGQQWQHDPDDIDSVVLGPNGVFLLEYKHWHGRIQAETDGPWEHQFVAGGAERRANPLPYLDEKRRCLLKFLADRQLTHLPVRVALVFPDRSTPVDPQGVEVTEVGGIPLLPLTQVAAWVPTAGEAGSLGKEVQSAIAEHLRPNSPRRLVNQYQLSTRLSRTENRTTYLAYDTVLERPVLMQELAYDPYQQPAQLERVRNELLREAKLTMQLKHENIVAVEHVIPRDDCYYVVTEWLDNCQSLGAQLARRGPTALPLEDAVHTALSVASALEYAHAQGIVHRDVRPDNVLVAPGGVVKVANFGHAKKADLGTRSTFDLRQMAQENPYVAPEFRLGQTGHHTVDQRADIFSLGAMLYQLLTGRLPHHMDEKYYEPPSSLNPEVPPALDMVIEKALRFDPAQRYSTMAAFRERLATWQAEPTEPATRYTERRLVMRTRNSLVYQAFDVKLQRHVALKKLLLDPRLIDVERLPQLKQLLREAQLASSLVHPHIVAVFDHFMEDGDGYIVMEWLEGLNLRESLDAKARFSFGQVKAIAQQVGEALQYAHHQGVVHRDIKPENIIYHENQATVLDFGIAFTTERGGTGDIQKTAGTARYMAPEVLIGSDIDVRADLFSLGVVLYELITGHYPYEASIIMARYTVQLMHPPVPASTLNIDCPTEVDAVLARALEIDPDKRYPNVAEFLTEFLSLEGSRPTRRDTTERGWGWPALIGLSAVVFVGFAGVGAYMTHNYKSMFTGAITPVPSPSLLMEASPSVVTRQELETRVWGEELPDSDSLRVHIHGLRA
ncbi:MAG: protein kinase domain-containing protein, partial [Candidatus Sericytochromatia bacterium]